MNQPAGGTGSGRAAVPGSERSALDGYEASGEIDASEQATVTVYLRRDHEPAGRMTREEFASRHGASDADLAAVRAFADAAGLRVDQVDQVRRAVVLHGSLGALSQAFGVGLRTYTHPQGGSYRGREGAVTVPAELDGVVTAVLGLDDRGQAAPQWRLNPHATAGYDPAQVAAAYAFPAGTDGSGQTVALIELGGGYRPADLTAYFAGIGTAVPSVTAVGVDGGSNTPGTANGPDGEVLLDIEVVGAAAAGAKVVVYFAPNTDRGFIDAVTTAVHDTTHRPSVVSISWGGPEITWTAQASTQMEQALTDAATVGVTVTVAAGDNGSADGVGDGAAHVDFPASAPHALACGGTRLVVAGAAPSAEVVWDDTAQGGGATGGGISDRFDLPAYQSSAGVPSSANPGGRVGRGVPDVAGDADPQTGYAVRVDGQDLVIGGTSAVAPLWAALVARLNQAIGRDVGDLHPVLYANPSALRDITSGTNGAYAAGPGWDACTGLGSPDGTRLLAALGGAKPAGPA